MKKKKFALWVALVMIAIIILLALLGPPIGAIFPVTSLITPTAPSTLEPSSGDAISSEELLKKVDAALSQFLLGSIAYNAPESMQVDEIVTLELLLNPSASEEELGGEIEVEGTIQTATIEITPLMKVELRAQDKDAFEIQNIHDDSVQVVSENQTTRWTWWVKAKKAGTQNLTLTVYRLIKYEGKEYWRAIESYQAKIAVKITFAQRIKSLDWKWVILTLITAILIPAFWRWIDNKNKKKKA